MEMVVGKILEYYYKFLMIFRKYHLFRNYF